jgi:hypothetical protein
MMPKIPRGVGERADEIDGGSPVEPERAGEDEHGGLPEHGNGEAEEAGHPHHVIERRVLPAGGENAQGHADEQGDDHGADGQLGRHLQAAQDHLEHRQSRSPARPQIAVQGRPQPSPVLDMERSVQPEEGPEGAHGFRAIGALGADDLVDHRARDEPHHQEDGEADAEQGGEERDDANHHEAAHGWARRSGGESAAGQRSSHTVRKP